MTPACEGLRCPAGADRGRRIKALLLTAGIFWFRWTKLAFALTLQFPVLVFLYLAFSRATFTFPQYLAAFQSAFHAIFWVILFLGGFVYGWSFDARSQYRRFLDTAS